MSYPKEKMEEISTSFCFICLLHLANEQGLKLESVPGGKATSVFEQPVAIADEVPTIDKTVGNLWDLKVWNILILFVVFRLLTPFVSFRCTGIRTLPLLHSKQRVRAVVYLISVSLNIALGSFTCISVA